MINKLLLKYFNRYIVTLRPMPDVITDTHRYYGNKVLHTAIRKYISTHVNNKRALGEFTNKDNSYSSFDSSFEISLRDVAFMILKIWKWRGEYKALIKLLPKTNYGRLLKTLLLEDILNIQFNLRGMASTNEVKIHNDTVYMVNDDLIIIAWDAKPKGEKNNEK